jgi:translation initiation factor 2A
VNIDWSPAANGVIITSFNDVDATNQSYYGEQKLHFMSADGSIEQAVPLQKEGPIHDVQWTPRYSSTTLLILH